MEGWLEKKTISSRSKQVRIYILIPSIYQYQIQYGLTGTLSRIPYSGELEKEMGCTQRCEAILF